MLLLIGKHLFRIAVCHSFCRFIGKCFFIAESNQLRLVLGDNRLTQELVVLVLKFLSLLLFLLLFLLVLGHFLPELFLIPSGFAVALGEGIFQPFNFSGMVFRDSYLFQSGFDLFKGHTLFVSVPKHFFKVHTDFLLAFHR